MSDSVDTSSFHPIARPTLTLAEQKIVFKIWHTTNWLALGLLHPKRTHLLICLLHSITIIHHHYRRAIKDWETLWRVSLPVMSWSWQHVTVCKLETQPSIIIPDRWFHYRNHCFINKHGNIQSLYLQPWRPFPAIVGSFAISKCWNWNFMNSLVP